MSIPDVRTNKVGMGGLKTLCCGLNGRSYLCEKGGKEWWKETSKFWHQLCPSSHHFSVTVDDSEVVLTEHEPVSHFHDV